MIIIIVDILAKSPWQIQWDKSLKIKKKKGGVPQKFNEAWN